jgi:hypothetical protein
MYKVQVRPVLLFQSRQKHQESKLPLVVVATMKVANMKVEKTTKA